MMPDNTPLLKPWRQVSLGKAAAHIGRSKSHLSRVLRGERKPGRDLARVLRQLGYTLPKVK